MLGAEDFNEEAVASARTIVAALGSRERMPIPMVESAIYHAALELLGRQIKSELDFLKTIDADEKPTSPEKSEPGKPE